MLACSVMSNSLWPHRLQPASFLCPWDSPGKNMRVGSSMGSCPLPGDFPNPGNEPSSPVSPALAGGFYITEPPGKPIYEVTCNQYLIKNIIMHWSKSCILGKERWLSLEVFFFFCLLCMFVLFLFCFPFCLPRHISPIWLLVTWLQITHEREFNCFLQRDKMCPQFSHFQ